MGFRLFNDETSWEQMSPAPQAEINNEEACVTMPPSEKQ